MPVPLAAAAPGVAAFGETEGEDEEEAPGESVGVAVELAAEALEGAAERVPVVRNDVSPETGCPSVLTTR